MKAKLIDDTDPQIRQQSQRKIVSGLVILSRFRKVKISTVRWEKRFYYVVKLDFIAGFFIKQKFVASTIADVMLIFIEWLSAF